MEKTSSTTTDVTRIISELERQRTALDRAIEALREVSGGRMSQNQPAKSEQRGNTTKPQKRRQLSPEGRQRIIEAAKKRWAASRAAASKQSAAGSRAQTKSARKTASAKKAAAKTA